MDRTLNLVSNTSNEIFMLRYPRSVLAFCEYDLAYFAENAIAVCNDALRDGELDFDRVTDLRNSIKDIHIYVENHLRTTYDKIVIDCWIDYLCRRDNVGTAALWNRFLKCSTSFEKSVFRRLCDYRYNKGINEWLNLVRVQDYAKNKISFIFSKKLTGADEAAARRNYFDLMFSVTASELGCRIEDLGVTKVFTVGRLPSAPFLFPNISKELVKSLLSDFDYSEDYSDTGSYGELADQLAMDAFAHMKRGLAQEFDSYNITRTSNKNTPLKVYMPCGLKAVIDLEIDALIESGGWLARCKRCGRYYLRDSEYTEEYCSLANTSGKTCLEQYRLEHPEERLSPDLEKQCREITDVVYARVDKTMSLSEYESWKTYLDALKGKVDSGEIPAEELTQFIEYSRSLDLSRSKPIVVEPKRAESAPRERERVIKPFVPERINRSELAAPKKAEEDPEEAAARKEGFFTSPSVMRQKNERTPISHIIRAGEPVERSAQPNSFVGFAEQHKPEPPAVQPEPSAPVPVAGQASRFAEFGAAIQPQASVIRADSAGEPKAYKGAFAEFGEPQNKAEEPSFDVFGSFSGEQEESGINAFSEVFGERGEKPQTIEKPQTAGKPLTTDKPQIAEKPLTTDKPQTAKKPQAAEMPQTAKKPQTTDKPQIAKQKVIRKNAAAISAYGKMSGTPLAASALDQVIPKETFGEIPAEKPQVNADPDPFKDIGSIFDSLEQGAPEKAETPPEKPAQKPQAEVKRTRRKREQEPVPEWEDKLPERVTEDNAPSGIWTEERGLFPQPEQQSELAMLKEKKRSRTNKTQHLYDAIMKEPEDNPNVRKK